MEVSIGLVCPIRLVLPSPIFCRRYWPVPEGDWASLTKAFKQQWTRSASGLNHHLNPPEPPWHHSLRSCSPGSSLAWTHSSNFSPFLVAPSPRVKDFCIPPHSTACATSLTFDVFVLISVCRDGVPVPNEPFPNVFAVARYASQYATVLVVSLDRDSNVFAADRLNQCALDTLSVVEPVPVLVSRHLIPLGRI